MPRLPECVCRRCDHHWTPRTTSPTQCPACKSRYWRKARPVKVDEAASAACKTQTVEAS